MKRNRILFAAVVLMLVAAALTLALAEGGGTSVRRGIAYESGNGWIYFAPLKGTDPVRLGKPRRLARGSDPVLSPNGRTVVFARYAPVTVSNFGGRPNGARLYAISTSGGKPKLLSTTKSGYSVVVWSPDSRHLFVDAYIIDVRNGTVERKLKADTSSASFSPDGRSLAYVGDEANGRADIFVVELSSGRTHRITDLGYVQDVLWGPKEIAFGGNRDDEIWLIDSNGKHLRQLGKRLIVGELYGEPVSWSADGRLLLTVGGPYAPRVVDAASGNVIYSAVTGSGELSRDGSLALIDNCIFFPSSPRAGRIEIVSLSGHRAASFVGSGCDASWNA